jgi:tRNA G26 N,N-dimethylase Trm1
MIELFKTNVKTKKQANKITKLLKINLGYNFVNFDLEDCEKILRIDAPNVLPHCVIDILKNENFECEILSE